MAVRHVFRVDGMPSFREDTQFTFLVPAYAGNSFPVEIEFPESLLAAPVQLQGSVFSGTSPQTTVTQQPSPFYPESLVTTQSSSSPTRTTMMSTQKPASLVPAIEGEGSLTPTPFSPGRQRLSPKTVRQTFLPSPSTQFQASRTATPQQQQSQQIPVMMSRSSLSVSPTPVLSPRGSLSVQSSARTSALTGQELSQQFSSGPRPISTTQPIVVSTRSPTAQSPAIKSSPTLGRKSATSSLSGLLTSPKMLSPSLAGLSSTGSPPPIIEGMQEPTEGMLPAMSVYRCSPAVDMSGDVCQRIL